MKCGTTNSSYSSARDATFFNDTNNMVTKFCKKYQDSFTCCNGAYSYACELSNSYNDIKSFNVNLAKLPYGDSCTYVLNSACGYPEFYVNNSNIDLLITYKK